MRAAGRVMGDSITRLKAVAGSLNIEISNVDSSEALKALVCNLIDNEKFRNEKATLDHLQDLMTVAGEYEWAPRLALKMLVHINSDSYLKPFRPKDNYTRLYEFTEIKKDEYKNLILEQERCIRLIANAVVMIDPDDKRFQKHTASLREFLSEYCYHVFASYKDGSEEIRFEIKEMLSKAFWSCDVFLENTLDHIPMTHRVLHSDRDLTNDNTLMKLAAQWPALAHRVLGHYLDNFMQDANIKRLFKLMQKAVEARDPASMLTMAILQFTGLRLPGVKTFDKRCTPNFQEGYDLLCDAMNVNNIYLNFKAIFVLGECYERSDQNRKSNTPKVFAIKQDLFQSYKLFKLLAELPCVDKHLQGQVKEKLVDAGYHLALIKDLARVDKSFEVLQICIYVSKIVEELKQEKEANSQNGSLGTSPIYEEGENGRLQYPIRSSTWTAGLTANFANNERRNGVNGVGHNSLNGITRANGLYSNGARKKIAMKENGRKKLSKSAIYGSPNDRDDDSYGSGSQINGKKEERKKLSKSEGNGHEKEKALDSCMFDMEF